MKYLNIFLAMVAFPLMAEKVSLDINFERLNHKGMCSAWINHPGTAFRPAPKVMISKEQEKNVIYFSEIQGKDGFSWGTRERFPVRSGDKVVISAKVRGSGKFAFGIQTLNKERRWTSRVKGVSQDLSPEWKNVVADFQIYNVGRSETGYFLIEFFAPRGTELYISDIKADLYRYSNKIEFKDNFVPAPVECNVFGETVFTGNNFYFENKSFLPESSLNWLAQGMKRVLGWERVSNGKDAVKIAFLSLSGKNYPSKEYYELKIEKNEIVIRAATKEGFFIGAGRLMGIIESKLIKNISGKGFQFPLMEIKDYPVISERAFMIHIAGASSPLKTLEQWRKLFYRQIDVAAMLGYNAVFISFGGRMELKSHPELVWRNVRFHTQEEIKRMISYASGLGMKVYPMTSVIGHYDSGYQIFPIQQEKARNINGRIVKAKAMNLGHPDFYKIFFEIFDEICEVFNKPEYVMIRSDEFFTEIPLLEKYTGKKCIDFYSEFLNRTVKYAGKCGSKIIVCQDMWVPARTPGEESNGPKDAEKLLDMVDKNISICYWRYDFSPLMWLKKFAEKGFKDLWVMPWYEPEPTRLLIAEGHKYGAKIFAGVWSEPGQNNGLSAIAEYAWNPYAKSFQMDRLNNHSDQMFYSRETKVTAQNAVFAIPSGGVKADHPDLKKVQMICNNDSGIPVNFSNATRFKGKSSYEKITQPLDLVALCKSGELKNYTFGVKGCPQRIGFSKSGVNKKRDAKELVIYTSDFGKSTKTNIYGTEFTIKDGIVGLTDRRLCDPDGLPVIGNFPIFKDSLTLSRHGLAFYDERRFQYRNSNMLIGKIRKGTELEFYKKVPGISPSGKVRFNLSGKRYKAVLYLQVTGRIETFDSLATVLAGTKDGKFIKDAVYAYRWHISGYHHQKNWHYYLPWQDELRRADISPVVAIEYSSDSPFTSLEIIPQKAAADAELLILGVTEYQISPIR